MKNVFTIVFMLVVAVAVAQKPEMGNMSATKPIEPASPNVKPELKAYEVTPVKGQQNQSSSNQQPASEPKMQATEVKATKPR